jgi:hypothetical protein
MQRVRRQNTRLAHQNQGGIRVRIQKCQTCGEGDSGAKVPAHGIHSDPDHESIGAVKDFCCGKRKARSMSAGRPSKREITLQL